MADVRKYDKKNRSHFWFTLFTASTIAFTLERAAFAKSIQTTTVSTTEDIATDETENLAHDIQQATNEVVPVSQSEQQPFVLEQNSELLLAPTDEQVSNEHLDEIASAENAGGGEIPLPETQSVVTEETSDPGWLVGAAIVGGAIAIALGSDSDSHKKQPPIDTPMEPTPEPEPEPDPEPIPSDFGDAPFQSTMDDPNGFAAHAVVDSGPYLGDLPGDVEADGQPDANLLGDDGNNLDDEDSFDGFFISGTTTNHQVTLYSVSGDGFLQGWIDFDDDNIFEASEAFFSSPVALTTSASTVAPAIDNQQLIDLILNSVSSNIPVIKDVRLRYASSEDDVMNPTGLAADGEIEDHCVSVFSPSGSASVIGIVCDLA